MKKTALKLAQNEKRKAKSHNLKLKTFLFFFLLTVVVFLGSAKAVSAQTFTFSPSTATKNLGEQFVINVTIDTAGQAVKGADAKVTYDPNLIEVVSVEKGEFFPKGGYNAENGLLYFSYGFDQALQTKTGSGVYAKLTLKGKATGTANFVWACSGQPSDTNIWDAQSSDIVKCPLTNGTYLIIQAASGPTDVPPTSAPAASNSTATPTPPVSGISLPTIFTIGAGLLLTIMGLAFSI